MKRSSDEMLMEMVDATLAEVSNAEQEYAAMPRRFRELMALQIGISPEQQREQFRTAAFYRAGRDGPLSEELGAAVMADPDLSRLFPYTDEQGTRVGLVTTSTGQGSLASLSTFGGGLIDLARTRLVGRPDWEARLRSEAQAVLDTVRRLARGEVAPIPMYTGFDGATLPTGAELPLPWGTLRSGCPPRPVPAFERPDANGQITLAYSLPASVTVRDPRAKGDMLDVDGLRQHAEREQRLIEATCLAVMLATSLRHREPVGMIQRTSWVPSPLGFGGGGGGAVLGPAFTSPQIQLADFATIQGWAEKVERVDLQPVKVAVRRTLSAIHRLSLEDQLIDAVIALENMFGASKGEQRMRVSHAAAWLLARDPSERESLAREVRDLYDERSALVHGETPSSRRNLHDDAKRAITLAANSLRELIDKRSDLLTDRDRWRQLLLDLRPDA